MATTEMIVHDNQPGFLAPVVTAQAALIAYQAKKDLIDGIMKPTVDFGVIPGSSKPTLLKAGAEKATSFFGLFPHFKDAGIVEDWTGEQHGGEPFFYYRRTCELWRGNQIVSSVDGSCNSWEKKYRYRSADRICPNCGKATIIKGQEKYGGGWLCFAKKGGCGAKFGDKDQQIIGQETGQVKNPDIADIVNTILKMADKRALVAATLIATGLSEYFTQDIEDYISGEIVDITPEPARQPVRTPIPQPIDDLDRDYPPMPQDWQEAKAAKETQQPTTNNNNNKPMNGVPRPYSPADFHAAMDKQKSIHAGKDVNPKQVSLCAMLLEVALMDEGKDARHTLTRWLFGKASLNDCDGAEVNALLKWLDPQKDSGGAYTPGKHVSAEAKAAYRQALIDEGQQELI